MLGKSLMMFWRLKNKSKATKLFNGWVIDYVDDIMCKWYCRSLYLKEPEDRLYVEAELITTVSEP